MFENFRKFLPKVFEDSEHPTHFEHHDYRLAAAALLVHTATIDGNMSDLERDQLHAVVKRRATTSRGFRLSSDVNQGSVLAAFEQSSTVWALLTSRRRR